MYICMYVCSPSYEDSKILFQEVENRRERAYLFYFISSEYTISCVILKIQPSDWLKTDN